MHARIWLVVSFASAVAVVLGTSSERPLRAQSAVDAAALTGIVSSAEEGAMEGVLVSVKRTGSTQTTTVVTDKEGRYRFPPTRLVVRPHVGWDHRSAVSRGLLGPLHDFQIP